MKKPDVRLILLFIFLSSILIDAKGQDIPPSLANRIKLIGMEYTPSEYYKMTYWESDFGKYACEEGSCPLNLLKIIHAKLSHKDGQCDIFVCVLGEARVRYERGLDKNKLTHCTNPTALSYNRIKNNFKYGLRFKSATKQETKDLDMMLHYYPQDSAKAYFNADYMVSYPYNMEGKKCKDSLSNGRVIVTGKDGLDVFIYFYLTDKSADNFDKYLSDFKRTLWFKD